MEALQRQDFSRNGKGKAGKKLAVVVVREVLDLIRRGIGLGIMLFLALTALGILNRVWDGVEEKVQGVLKHEQPKTQGVYPAIGQARVPYGIQPGLKRRPRLEAGETIRESGYFLRSLDEFIRSLSRFRRP